MNQRYAHALALRRQGLSFREVGKQLGVGSERARQMVAKAGRMEQRDNGELGVLSTRAQNVLGGNGITTAAQLRSMSRADLARLKHGAMGLGNTTLDEIESAFALAEPHVHKCACGATWSHQ